MLDRFETFTVMITKMNRNIKRIKTEEMTEYGLKSTHVSILYYLYREHSLTAKELCTLCDEDKASISRALDYLESSGYVTSDTTQKKKYNTSIVLTDSGKDIGNVIATKIDKVLDIASDGLSEEDRVVLYRSLDVINKNIQNICESYDK